MNPKEERKQDAENGHIKELKDKGYICDRTMGKDYVFISYSSLNWKKVLYDIVYETCKTYGLRVYFDTKFDVGSDSWLTQFKDNMCGEEGSDEENYCKAVLVFLSPEYYESYATLIELMASLSSDAENIPILPIRVGNSNVISKANNGLGTYRFSDNSINALWEKEVTLFNKLFREMIADGQFSDIGKAKVRYTKYDEAKKWEPYYEELKYERLCENEAYWESKNIHTDEEKEEHWENLGKGTKQKRNEIFLTKKNNQQLMSLLWDKIDAKEIDGINADIPKTIYDTLNNLGLKSVFDKELAVDNKLDTRQELLTTENRTENEDASQTIEDTEQGGSVKETEPQVPTADNGYTYTVFGKEYHAEKGEQGKLMYDVFEALVEKYPDKADQLTARTSIARAEDVVDPGTNQAKPPYFRSCKKFTVGTQDYYVGISYGFQAKLAEIKGMLKICGESKDAFRMADEKMQSEPQENMESEIYKYTILGKDYTAGNREQGKLMYDLFEALMEKHPDKIPALTKCTSVEKAENVKNRNTKDAVPVYFRASDHKPFIVNGQEYFVGTSYDFKAKIAQMMQMLKLCGEPESAFNVNARPEIKTRTAQTKKALDESM